MISKITTHLYCSLALLQYKTREDEIVDSIPMREVKLCFLHTNLAML